MLGASYAHNNNWSSTFVDTYVVPAGPSSGVTITTPGNYLLSQSNTPDCFGQYEKDQLMFAAEFQRLSGNLLFQDLSAQVYDLRSWYARWAATS